jgi:hypothetical protein
MQGIHVDTLYGKSYRFDIRRKDHIFSSPDFLVYRDGKFWKSRKSLAEAVELCR